MIRALSQEPINGRWLVTGLVGRGSEATIYRAFDLVAERLVAVKAFAGRRGLRSSAGATRNEFVRLSRCRHPNLVEAFELGEAADGPLPRGTPFFTMELLQDAPLLSERAADARALARLAFDVLGALECLHSHGLVHNDLKPENVLLDSSRAEARYKLADLGLAGNSASRRRGLASRRSLAAPRGTVAYMAPEAIAGARTDPRSDLYSLGVLLFEAATGGLPHALDPGERFDADGHSSASRGRGASLPAPLARFVSRLLSERPGERPESAGEAREEVAAALGSSAEGEAEGDFDGPLVGRAREQGRLRRWLHEDRAGPVGLGLQGEPGSGLTRLAREAALVAKSAGWSVHQWSCRPADAPFAGLRRVLREIILRRSVRVAPGRPTCEEALALLGGPALWDAPAALHARAERTLARAISSFLLARPPGLPVLIVLDDYDRAEAGTRLVTEALASHVPAGEALRVLTARHDASAGERRPWLHRPGGEWRAAGGAAHRPAEDLVVRPLDRAQGRRLILSLPGAARMISAEACDAILLAACGHAGRIVRLARAATGRQGALFPPLLVPRAASGARRTDTRPWHPAGLSRGNPLRW